MLPNTISHNGDGRQAIAAYNNWQDEEISRLEAEYQAIAAVAAKLNEQAIALSVRERPMQRVESDIQHHVAAIRQIQDEADKLEANLEYHKLALLDLLPEYTESVGSRWADLEGYAQIIPATERFSYNSAALEVLRLSGSPAIRKALEPHRQVFKVKEHVRVK